jgi:hypothetical protein
MPFLLLLQLLVRVGLESQWMVYHLGEAEGGVGAGEVGQGGVGGAEAGVVQLLLCQGAKWQQQGTHWRTVRLLLLLLLMLTAGWTQACACSCCHTRQHCRSCGRQLLLLRRC